MRIFAFDTETFPIGPGEIVPRMVCLQWSVREGPQPPRAFVFAAADPRTYALLRDVLTDPDIILVGHNVAYDLAVIIRQFPDLLSLVWQALEDGRVSDTQIREKLLNLSTFGSLQFARGPDGTTRHLGYGLDDLALFYLGIDMKAAKGIDSWRTNYHMLADKPVEQWPPEATKYAEDDAINTLLVHEQQQKRVKSERGYASLGTEFYQTACNFGLFMSTAEGFAVDQEEVKRIRAWLAQELTDAKVNLLLETGILRPGEEPRPHSAQLKRATELVGGIAPKSWASHRERLEALGIKFTAGADRSIDTTKLKEVVLMVANANAIKVKLTEGGTQAKRDGLAFDVKHISTDSEVMDDLAEHDPVLAQYQHRQELQKLVTTELGCAEFQGQPSARVYPNFNVLVETGRTSSSGGYRGKPGLYPSRNIQNPHPKARPMFLPDPGNVLVSVDYSSLELVTLAQVTYRLFGHSKLRDLINGGTNPHTYMGAQLAYALNADFRSAADGLGLGGNAMGLHDHFARFKKHEDPNVRAFFEHWRKFAKPTNLGYPGGLGPAKFVSYAKKTYDVICDFETAKMLREVWRATFPEVVEFHNYVSSRMQDQNTPQTYDEETDTWEPSYAYTSFLGMHRAAATFCAAANGFGMQTPGAEPGKWAYFKVSRACYDPSVGSVLFGARPKAFIHDEILAQVSADVDLGNAQAREIQRVMEEELARYCPDVKVATEAAMMLRWSKSAKPVLDQQNRLIPWQDEAMMKNSGAAPASTPHTASAP